LDQGFVDPESSLTYISNGSNKFKKGTKVPLKAISAHRDVGKTACPGNPIYGSLGSLRTSAAKDGLPKLYDAKTSRSIITPNGDGVSDSLKLTGRISSQASWKVDVIDAAGTALKAVSGFGTTLSLNWYGKDAAGAAVPHGTYRFRVSAKNSVGTVRTSYIPFQVWRYPNGTFFQTKGSKITYILEKNVLRHPSHWQARSTRYLAGELVSVGDDITTAYAKGSQIGFRDGSVVSVEGTLYVISDGLRRQTTQSSLAALGYDPGATIETTPGAIAPNREGQPFSSSQGYPDGAALKSSTGQEAWVRTGIARRFFSTNVRTSWQLRDVDLAGPADSKVSEGLSQDPLGFRDGTLVRVADATTIYIISDGMRRAFSSAAAFARMGYKEENVRAVTPGELALHAEGKPI
jgi:hypothetical protein